jgi:hypothetical protein
MLKTGVTAYASIGGSGHIEKEHIRDCLPAAACTGKAVNMQAALSFSC